MTDKAFDPEKVGRVKITSFSMDAPRCDILEVIRASDYDKLLALYREAVKGLQSIAANTCCDGFREAALVAKAALEIAI